MRKDIMQDKKIEIRYFSRSGNTKKVAEAMAEQLGIKAYDITKKVEQADILFLGAAIYWLKIDQKVKKFITELDASKVHMVIIFSTSFFTELAYPELKEKLIKKGIKVENRYFYCHGALMKYHDQRVSQESLNDAKRFAKVLSEKTD